MTQSPENKEYAIEETIKILQSQVESMPPSPTSVRYLRVLQSLTSFVSAGMHVACVPSTNTNDNSSLIIDNLSLALTDWLVSLWLTGTPYSTASLYLDIISSLYGAAVRVGLLPKTDLFKQLKIALKTLGQPGWTGGIDEEIFQRALRLTKNAASLISDDAIAADLVILSLTRVLQPLESLALLKTHAKTAEEQSPQKEMNTALFASLRSSGEMREDPILQQIQARHCKNARRKYIFPLNQNQRTEAGLKKHVAKTVNVLFKRARLPQATDPNQTVEALWAFAALSIGIPASSLVSHLGHAPLGLPVLKLSAVSGQSTERAAVLSSGERTLNTEDLRLKTKDLAAIGRVFLENPPRWYALSLRPGVRFTQLCRRLELLQRNENLRLKTEDLSFFYPCEEIARAVGKKIVIRERPFIHSVVFFHAKLTDIGPLLAKIGDLAWCYRQSAAPGAPYAEISDRQFRLFQQTIARFTPDYEVAQAGELELRPNDRVEILGGLFAGHEASFDRVEKAEEGVVYRLNIVGDNGFEWRVSIDKRLTTKKTNYLE